MTTEFTVTDAMAKEMAELSIKEADIRDRIAKARTELSVAEKTYQDAIEVAEKANEPTLSIARGVFGDIENQCRIELNDIEIRKRQIAVEAKDTVKDS